MDGWREREATSSDVAAVTPTPAAAPGPIPGNAHRPPLSARLARSLAAAIGNQGMIRLLSRKMKYAVDQNVEVWVDEVDPRERQEAVRLVALLRDRYGIRLDSPDAAARIKEKYRAKRRGAEAAFEKEQAGAAPGTSPPSARPPSEAAFEQVLADVSPDAWDLEELRGIVAALDTPLAGAGGPTVQDLRLLDFPPGEVPRPRPPDQGPQPLSFGKTTFTIGQQWTTDAVGQAETIVGSGGAPHTVAVQCASRGVEIPPPDRDDPVAQARATTIHELGHTIYVTFQQTWRAKFDQTFGVEKAEAPPTDYAETDAAEDFAESFMLHTLYPRLLQANAPKRWRFFESVKAGLVGKIEDALEERAGRAEAAPAAAAPPPPAAAGVK